VKIVPPAENTGNPYFPLPFFQKQTILACKI